MDISLTPNLIHKIEEKISSGGYKNVNEVVSETLRLLDERDTAKKRDANLLMQDIQAGYKSGGRIELDVKND